MADRLALPSSDQLWFDLASPWRRRIVLPPNPPQWVHTIDLEFPRGRLNDPQTLLVADRARRPFVCRARTFHDDGSVARITLFLPAGCLFERQFPEWVDVYYGGAVQNQAPIVEWNALERSVTTPGYEAEFDMAGAIRRFSYLPIDQDLVDSTCAAGIAPVAFDGSTVDVLSTPAKRLGIEPWMGSEPALVLSIEQDARAATLTRRFLCAPEFIAIEFHAEIRKRLSFFSPFAIHHRPGSGTVITADSKRIEAGVGGAPVQKIATSPEFPGYVFSSQTGAFVFSGEEGPEELRYLAKDPAPGLMAFGYSNVSPGDRLSGRIYLVPAPFAGDFTADRGLEIRRLLLAPCGDAPEVGEEETLSESWRPRAESVSGGAISLSVGGLRFVAEPAPHARRTLRTRLETADHRPLLTMDKPYGLEGDDGAAVWTGPSAAQLRSDVLHLETELTGPRGGRWRLRSRIAPRLLAGRVLFEEERRYTLLGPEPVECRFRIDARTPVGPPTWDSGKATVFIPGQMARGNYRPGHPHGGGPKWGPAAQPELCDFCKTKDSPGHANQWIVPASRLPNTWAMAADRDQGLLAFLGAEVRSGLGESCVGFHSPGRGTTTLQLATPITYEPWVPHGYGGFDRAPRRDTTILTPGQELVWRIYYSGDSTQNLNGWLDLDRAMYGLAAPFRPNAFKMPYESALRLCLDSLHRNFYRPKDHVITYSTGPDGQTSPIGFTGMAHSALALLEGGTRLGVPQWRDAGLDVLNEVAWAFLHGPCFPFAAWTVENGWVAGSGEPGYLILCALDNLLEAIANERARGEDRGDWVRGAKRCCDAWIGSQSPAGAFPLKHPAMGADIFPTADYDATNVTVGVIACLVEAWKLFGEERYLAAARHAAEFYGGLLDQGKMWGGPGDIEALVNSEVPMFYLRSFVRLALATSEPRHKAWARDAAAWRLAFQFAHCWPLDFGAPLYRQGWAGLGSENASASNLHSVCFGNVNVPDYRLAHQLFGDPHWIERLKDLADYATQQYGRFDGDVGILDAGQGTESWWTSDTKWGKGAILLLLDKPNLGFMSWTTGWSAYGLLHALRIRDEGGLL